jgi:hypothetical protein
MASTKKPLSSRFKAEFEPAPSHKFAFEETMPTTILVLDSYKPDISEYSSSNAGDFESDATRNASPLGGHHENFNSLRQKVPGLIHGTTVGAACFVPVAEFAVVPSHHPIHGTLISP